MKWVLLGFVIAMALGIGAWMAIDPNARATASQLSAQVTASLTGGTGNINVQGLLDPVAKAFKSFADSVAGLWSAPSVQIDVPSVQVPH